MASTKDIMKMLETKLMLKYRPAGSHVNGNDVPLFYYPEHNAPTTLAVIGGAFADSATQSAAFLKTGTGQTGGWGGGRYTDPLGTPDRGNWAGQRDAGLPNQNLENGLIAQLYAIPKPVPASHNKLPELENNPLKPELTPTPSLKIR